jgi:hypothetical protein
MRFRITLDVKGVAGAAECLRRNIERFLKEKVRDLTVKIIKDKIVATFTMVKDISLDLVGRLKDNLGYPHLPAIAKMSE